MASKRVSFHVGVRTYDASVFPTAAPLQSPADDVRAMYNLANDLGYTPLDLVSRGPWIGATPAPPNVLTDTAATYSTVVGLFQSAAALLQKKGDSCFITFSGHGTQFSNIEIHPTLDGALDEAVCLHDYTLLDDVIYGLLAGFENDVNVLLVLDCCHAGATNPSGILESLKKSFDNLFSGKLFRATERVPKRPTPRQSSSPYGIKKVTKKPVKGPPQLAIDLQTQFKDFGRPNLRANVAVFQACGDKEDTFDGKNPGDLSVYTQKFVSAARNGATTIGGLKNAIATALPQITNCTPQFQPEGDANILATLLKP